MTPNQKTRQRKLAQAMLPHIAIVLHSANDSVKLLDLRTHRQLALNPIGADVLLGLEHKWHIYTSIFMRVNGDDVTKTHSHAMQEPYKQSDLIDYLNDCHQRQLKAERKDAVTGFGWLALPRHRDLTEQTIDKLYSVALTL